MILNTQMCNNYTNLLPEEICLLQKLSEFLPYIADLTRADIFIDVLTLKDGEALVIAEANPKEVKSLYSQSVVGEIAYQINEPAVFRAIQTALPIWEVKGITQEGKSVKQTVTPIKTIAGKVIGALIMEEDISELMETEAKVELLSETTDKLTSALLDVATVEEVLPTIIQDAVFITDSKYKILYANGLAKNILESILGGGEYPQLPKVIVDTFPGYDDHVEGNGYEVLINQRVYKVKYVPLKKSNTVVNSIFLLRDITDLRNKEKELVVKATVIKEINHRVKNNLQTVASLLRLQMRRLDSEAIDSDTIKKVLLDSIHRISSIALVHEVLADEGLDEVELLPLLDKVARLTLQSCTNKENIIFSITGEKVLLSSDQATGTAMVINELLHNALEHGLVDGDEGEISIKISKELGYIIINFTDNGVGLSPDFMLEKAAGLGLTIVDSIVKEKLKGTITFKSQKGTQIEMKISTL